MDLKVNGIGDPTVLSGDVLHRVVRPETKVNVLVQPLHSVGVMAPLISARRRDLNSHRSQRCQGKQSSAIPDGRRISPIGEVVKGRNRVLGKRILRGHGRTRLSYFRV